MGDSIPADLQHQIKSLVSQYGEEACQKALNRCKVEPLNQPNPVDELVDVWLDACFDACFITNHQGNIKRVNSAALSLFGFRGRDAEVLDKDISDFIGPEATIIRDGEMANFTSLEDLQGKKQNGLEFPAQVAIRHFGCGTERLCIAMCRERSHHQQQTQQITAQLTLMDSILDASFDVIMITDGKGIITKVNKATLDEFGYGSAEELVGKNVKILVGGGHAESHDEYITDFYKRGKTSSVLGRQRQVVALRKNKTEFPCILGIRSVTAGSENVMVCFVRDITEELRAMEMAMEKRAAEELLLNVLPEQVAVRLKSDPGHIADHFSTATVLFADIVGFTKMSSTLEPVQVVKLLNDLFSRFDERLDKYGLNKVKTIGDCYMVTSIPNNAKDPNRGCSAVCHFALDLLEELADFNSSMGEPPYLDLRVGINTGSLVAGVVGTKRFLYDIWGHSVNFASRMESTGVPGKIQITESVLDYLDTAEFKTERRGTVQVKGIGEVETYFLVDRLQMERQVMMGGMHIQQQESTKTFRSLMETIEHVKNTQIPQGTIAATKPGLVTQ